MYIFIFFKLKIRVPGMTHPLVTLLLENGYLSLSSLMELEPESLMKMMELGLKFELKVASLDYINTSMLKISLGHYINSKYH